MHFFRTEVVESESGIAYGMIRLSKPISGWVATFIALFICTVAAIFAVHGSIARKSRVAGVTVPIGGNISIYSPNTSIVRKFLVSEGDQVTAGQPMFELSTERENQQGEITTLVAQQLENRKNSLQTERRLNTVTGRERNDDLQRKLKNLLLTAEQIEQETELAVRRTILAKTALEKYETLEANGFISSLQLQVQQGDLIDANSKLLSLKRSKLANQENINTVTAEQRALRTVISTEQAKIDGGLAVIKQEITENIFRKSFIIKAPQNGILTTINLQEGQLVNSGQLIATLIPSSVDGPRLEVHLYAPSSATGFVLPGQTVLLRFQSFAYEKFGLQRGVVTDVSQTPFAPSELPANLATTILSGSQKTTSGHYANEALYRIKVKLDKQGVNVYGKFQTLKPGMTVEADVVQERRKIWEWLAAPILAVTKNRG